NPLVGPTDWTVLAHGLDEVLAAAWLEAADRRQNRSQNEPVEPDAADQDGAQHEAERPQQPRNHDFGPSCAILRATWRTSRGNDRFNSSSVGSSGLRGISTRSRPVGISWRVSRKASRYSRRSRLRCVAWPTFRDTDSPRRRCGRLFSQA